MAAVEVIDLTLDSDESDEEEASTSGIEKTYSSDRCVCVCVCVCVCWCVCACPYTMQLCFLFL